MMPADMEDLATVEARLERLLTSNVEDLRRVNDELRNEVTDLKGRVAELQQRMAGIGASAQDRYAALAASNHVAIEAAARTGR